MRSPIPLVRTLLLNNAPVSAALGGTRIWANEIPQGTARPAIRLVEVSGAPVGETLDRTTEPWDRRFSVECQGDSSVQADDLAEKVLEALDGFSGVADGLDVQALRVVSDAFVYEDTLRVILRIIDFRIVYGNET